MNKEELKKQLLKNGVKNLKIFGYPHVTVDNILTDEVYSMTYKSMLKENKGADKVIDDAIDELLKIIAENEK